MALLLGDMIEVNSQLIKLNRDMIEVNSELIQLNMNKTAELTDIVFDLWSYLMFIWFIGGVSFIMLACQINGLTAGVEKLIDERDPEKESLLYTKL